LILIKSIQVAVRIRPNRGRPPDSLLKAKNVFDPTFAFLASLAGMEPAISRLEPNSCVNGATFSSMNKREYRVQIDLGDLLGCSPIAQIQRNILLIKGYHSV
jgi:hypothetical protein